MSSSHLPSIEALIKELNRLPGIGPKSATALAYHLVQQSADQLNRFSQVLSSIPERIHPCIVCGNLAESDSCRVCSDTSRDPRVVCVVEHPLDVVSIEKTGAFAGRYHVLGGVLSPLDGIGPAQLRIRELFSRIDGGEITEIILATNPSVEGEATASYLQDSLTRMGRNLMVTRFARGLPVGGDLAYTDSETLSLAIRSRKAMDP